MIDIIISFLAGTVIGIIAGTVLTVWITLTMEWGPDD